MADKYVKVDYEGIEDTTFVEPNYETDKLMYWSDIDLDDVPVMNAFQQALAKEDYTAYNILQSNHVFYFGAWLINKFVNRLKAIESYIPNIYKPKASINTVEEPTAEDVRPEIQVKTNSGYVDSIVWINPNEDMLLKVTSAAWTDNKISATYNKNHIEITMTGYTAGKGITFYLENEILSPGTYTLGIDSVNHGEFEIQLVMVNTSNNAIIRVPIGTGSSGCSFTLSSNARLSFIGVMPKTRANGSFTFTLNKITT